MTLHTIDPIERGTALVTAVLSDDGLYRYRLERQTGTLAGVGTVVWVMCNPSTADATTDDPTIRRVMRFSHDMGMALVVVVNLCAFRSPEPEVLYEAAGAGVDPVGRLNVVFVEEAVMEASLVVAAWGEIGRRAAVEFMTPDVVAMCEREDVQLRALGKTRSGAPRHPLYVPASAAHDLVDFP